jgi:hypothetical protein
MFIGIGLIIIVIIVVAVLFLRRTNAAAHGGRSSLAISPGAAVPNPGPRRPVQPSSATGIFIR